MKDVIMLVLWVYHLHGAGYLMPAKVWQAPAKSSKTSNAMFGKEDGRLPCLLGRYAREIEKGRQQVWRMGLCCCCMRCESHMKLDREGMMDEAHPMHPPASQPYVP